ncbi:hypothetical protein STVIR_8695 [Streptomyces viridochromogenes Tue57]|uniref:Uncharacterized protein n=1 Tax=Streptomyces viridochromogenes Tue57 TaxID=1160705 RepID=L8NYE6_STRVR|nr:hypothetical protein STVIR_8695 [Streptomyces viridochromogenes Tue57]
MLRPRRIRPTRPTRIRWRYPHLNRTAPYRRSESPTDRSWLRRARRSADGGAGPALVRKGPKGPKDMAWALLVLPTAGSPARDVRLGL